MDRVAWVHEMSDDERLGRYTGQFEVALEGPGSRIVQGPRNVPLEEAVAWARERTEVVLVSVAGEVTYSAGTRRPSGPGPKFLALPSPVPTFRPRPRGTPIDGSVQEVSWGFVLTLAVSSPAAAQPVVRLLKEAQRVERVRSRKGPGGEVVKVRFSIRGPDADGPGDLATVLLGRIYELRAPGVLVMGMRGE
jgi:hypothetical protein